MKKILYLFSFAAFIILTIFTFNFFHPKENKAVIVPSIKTYLLVGTYTQKESHVDGKAKGFYIYEMDNKTGVISYLCSSPFALNPTYAAIHPNKKWVYTINEIGGSQAKDCGTVTAYQIDLDKKQIKLINQVSSLGNYPCYIRVDKSGNFAMAANYGSGNVALIPINDIGYLQKPISQHQHIGKGFHSRQDGPHAHSIVPSNNGRFWYSADLGTDQIFCYTIDPKNLSLISSEEVTQLQPQAGPRHIAMHPTLGYAYVINELNGTISVYKVDLVSGSLTSLQVVASQTEVKATLAGCADIHVAPSGKYLYASNRGNVNSISVFAIDEANGKITFVGSQSTKGKTPRSFAIDPSGRFLLAANQDSSDIVTFNIDPKSGKLIDNGVSCKVPTPVCLIFF